MIVFEGVNRSGKSTLAQLVGKELKLPVIRVCSISQSKGLAPLSHIIESIDGTRTNDFYEDMVQMEFINQSKFNKVIFDRSLPSAIAYRKLKQQPKLPIEILEWWFTSLKKNNGLYVWVKSSWDTVVSRGFKKGWLETFDHYKLLDDKFGDLFDCAQQLGCDAIDIKNETDTDIKYLVDTIVNVYVSMQWRNENI